MGIKRHINIDLTELTDEERMDWLEEEKHRKYIYRTQSMFDPDTWEEEDEDFDWDE